MSWSSAVQDLRKRLSDGDADKYRYRQKVFGDINGSNVFFKTFEYRRLTNFATQVAGPTGVYLNGTRIANTAVAADDLPSGEFSLVTAPADGARLEATFYLQWFIDAELTEFLNSAGQWIGVGNDFNNIEDGLQPAALEQAAGEAYQKLALRWLDDNSAVYRVQDQGDKPKIIINPYMQSSKQAKDEAIRLRKGFYSRQDQFESPLYGNNFGAVRDPTPKR